VAVIIPAFNVESFLDQTLASVAGQTRPADIVVVADDCSADDTAQRAGRWVGRLPIEVVRLERNEGPGPARHQAIQATDAQLLAMLDADDLWLPDHLETMIAAYERAPGLVSAQELSWMPGRGIDLAARRAQATSIPAGRAAQLAALLHHNYVNFPLFARTTYEGAGGFRGFSRGAEDWDLWIRMLRAGVTMTQAPHPTALHRVRPQSLSVDPHRTVELGIAVLITALAEADSAHERRAAARGLRALVARKRYYDAFALAIDGHPWRARFTAARGSRGGGWKVAAGLTALAVAPGASIRLEQLTRRYRVFHPE
jgi:glycosyltransferase involved in cell wall biosynthesis